MAITALGDGRYEVRYKTGPGKYPRKVIKGKAAAQRFETEMQHAYLSGSAVDPRQAKRPLRFFAAEWLAAQPESAHTNQNKSSHLRNHLLPVLGDEPIGSITHLVMQKWIAVLQQKGLSANTIRHVSGTARSLFADAKRAGLIAQNPCADWKRPKVQKRKIVPAKIEHIHACISEMDERLQAAVLFAAGTGLRPAEIFGVKIDDFVQVPKHCTIHVRRQVHSYTGQPQQETTHTKTFQERVIPIDDGLAEILVAHINRYPSADRYIFTNQLGKPMHSHVFNRAWLRARRKVASAIRAEAESKHAGNPIARCRMNVSADFIERLRFYDLRHFYASLIMKKTKNVKLVQALLGHTTAQMSLDNYVHLADEDLDAARKATKKLFKIN